MFLLIKKLWVILIKKITRNSWPCERCDTFITWILSLANLFSGANNFLMYCITLYVFTVSYVFYVYTANTALLSAAIFYELHTRLILTSIVLATVIKGHITVVFRRALFSIHYQVRHRMSLKLSYVFGYLQLPLALTHYKAVTSGTVRTYTFLHLLFNNKEIYLPTSFIVFFCKLVLWYICCVIILSEVKIWK